MFVTVNVLVTDGPRISSSVPMPVPWIANVYGNRQPRMRFHFLLRRTLLCCLACRNADSIIHSLRGMSRNVRLQAGSKMGDNGPLN